MEQLDRVFMTDDGSADEGLYQHLPEEREYMKCLLPICFLCGKSGKYGKIGFFSDVTYAINLSGSKMTGEAE